MSDDINTSVPPPPEHTCAVCNKEATNKCAQCRLVWYCSRPCQAKDWKEGHRDICRGVFAPCDECKNPDETKHPLTNCCMACGHLFCDLCGENYIQRDSPDRRPGFRGNITRFSPCPSCGDPTSLDFVPRKNWKRLEKLFYEKVNDPRRGQWMINLGALYSDHGLPFEKVKKCFLIAATEGGMAEGYSRIAEKYADRKDWEAVQMYYEKAAKLNHPVALHCLTIKALRGFFEFGEDFWGPQNPSDQSPIDVSRALKLNKRAVKLKYPPACALAAQNYFRGKNGVARDPAKAYDYAVLALDNEVHPYCQEQAAICVVVGLAEELLPTLCDERAKAWVAANREHYRYSPLIEEETQKVRALKGMFSGLM